MDLSGLHDLMNAEALLQGFGPWVLLGLGIIVFIESGLLFPFLPGDSLLVTAAILHRQLGLQVWQIVVVAVVAAFLGDQAGYWLGHTFGRRLFRPGARVLRTDRLDRAEAFFHRYGPPALVLGRFVPVVRTYVQLAAGTARMPYGRFLVWNVLGAIGWVGSMTLVGVLLGGIPGVATSIDKIVLVVVAVSLLPVAVPAARSWLRSRGARAQPPAGGSAGAEGAAAAKAREVDLPVRHGSHRP